MFLREEHPGPHKIQPEALVSSTADPPEVHPVLFEQLTGHTKIRDAALRTQGSAGLSGMDAAGWRRICTTFHYNCAGRTPPLFRLRWSCLPLPFPGMRPHTTQQEPRCSSDCSVRGAQENRWKGSHASAAPGCVKSGWASSALLRAGIAVKVAPSFWFLNRNVLIFFVKTVLKLSQENVVKILWQFTVKILTK